MLSIEAIQTTAAAAIANAQYLTDLPSVKVIVARGLECSTVEDELSGKGCVVVVNPILRAVKQDASAGAVALIAEFSVECIINPNRNFEADGALRESEKLITAVASALIRWKPGPGDTRFEPSEEFVNLDVGEDGVWQYTLFFQKKTALSVSLT